MQHTKSTRVVRSDLMIPGFRVTAGTHMNNYQVECNHCDWRRADVWKGCYDRALTHAMLNGVRAPGFHIREARHA